MEEKIEPLLDLLSKALKRPLHTIPGGETFKNTVSQGFGMRVVIGNSTKIFRLNFPSKDNVSIDKLISIDVWNGKDSEPFANIKIDGKIDEKIIPEIAKMIMKPEIGKDFKLGEALINETDSETSIQISAGGDNEIYGKTEQEKQLPNPSKISYQQTLKDLKSLVVGLVKGISKGLFVFGRSGTSKTFEVEKTLNDMGLEENDGYFTVSGSVTEPEVYKALFRNRNKSDIILFDDSDAVFNNQDARNLLKHATDTKPKRVITYAKTGSWLYDPKDENVPQDKIGTELFPKQFVFEGRIIFISNLSLDKIDPDGGLRTRALMINVDPTDKEIIEYMMEIIDKIKLEDGLQLSHEDRLKALEIVKNSSRQDISIRKLVRTMNFIASGLPNAESLARLYA